MHNKYITNIYTNPNTHTDNGKVKINRALIMNGSKGLR